MCSSVNSPRVSFLYVFFFSDLTDNNFLYSQQSTRAGGGTVDDGPSARASQGNEQEELSPSVAFFVSFVCFVINQTTIEKTTSKKQKLI